MEPYVITEVRVVVELGVPAVSGALPLRVSAEDMDDAVLDLLCHLNEVHVIPATGGTLNLHSMSGSYSCNAVHRRLPEPRPHRTGRSAVDSQ